MDKYRIMVFSWNTKSISLCETLDVDIADQHRSGTFTSWRYPSIIPDFYPKWAELIQDNNPDIIVIGFQEDRHPGSYFHSHLLPEQMPLLEYKLIKRTKLMGVGVTSFRGLQNLDPIRRGIRVSIYAKISLAALIEKEEIELRGVMGNNGQSEYVCSSSLTRSKGATASYLVLPGYGRLVFICCHLPFHAKSLITERFYKNKMLRQNELNYSNTCFNNIIEDLVFFKNPMPTYVFYFGDFNYRLADPRPATEVANLFNQNPNDKEFFYNMYTMYDELKDQMRRGNIYEFLEGIENKGPMFLPTCKMEKGRDTNDIECQWKTGKYDQRVPSWCDRIIYNKYGDDHHTLQCTYYDRFDSGDVMSQSDHAGVIGLFDLS